MNLPTGLIPTTEKIHGDALGTKFIATRRESDYPRRGYS
ncbi:hypothetical protein K239x_40210 [Planctomycetes bacterium K23_9]|uniref:Uncharacterized protein n=1 Tax=Stieleria marina TaxID=1930275 RepID=A0A517NY13_9BACT|nr:hypothetical protein K239x_40210 [Planctomycetes bacterium K23_9]